MSVQYHVLRDVCGTEMAFPNPTRQWRTGAGECGGGVQTPPPPKFTCGSGAPRNFVRGGGGGSTNSVEDRGQRERGPGGGSPLIRGSGGSCNLVQEMSFRIVKFS